MPLTPKQFAQVLLDLRTEHRLSQEAAARKIGVSPRQYSRWEEGATTPFLSNIDKVITAYGVDPSVVMGESAVTPGELVSRLGALEEKVDRLVSELLPAVAALEADLHRLALATESNGQRSAAKPSRRRAS